MKRAVKKENKIKLAKNAPVTDHHPPRNSPIGQFVAALPLFSFPIAIISALIAYGQMKLNVASQRAWLAPFSVAIDSDLVTDKDFHIRVLYKNVGREPATMVGTWASIRFVPNDQNSLTNVLGQDSEAICISNSANPARSLTTYPSEIAYENYVDAIADSDVSPVLKGTSILFVEGCMLYKTFGEDHHSAFCFYWVPEPFKPPKDWHWRFCLKGNQAT